MITSELPEAVTQHLSTIAADGMDVFLLADGNYRGILLHGTWLVNQMRANHRLGLMETLILGHGYLAAGLLTGLVKGNDRIRLDVTCDGPVGGISVDANARGEIRGYLRNPAIQMETAPESFDTAPFIGNGTMTVTRTLEGARKPVSGHVSLKHGALAEDLAHYFLVSEQKPSAISLSVQFDKQGMVIGAGGLFVQALPESDQSAAAELDEAVCALPSLGTRFASGDTPANVVHKMLSGFKPEMVGSKIAEMSCPCGRERFGRYLRSLPGAELRDIIENGPLPLKVTCHYCSSTYIYEKEIIQSLAGV